MIFRKQYYPIPNLWLIGILEDPSYNNSTVDFFYFRTHARGECLKKITNNSVSAEPVRMTDAELAKKLWHYQAVEGIDTLAAWRLFSHRTMDSME